nr:hypothetical protein [Oscillospiraceae bacterium]
MLVHADRILLSKNIRFLRNRRKMSRSKFARYISISGNELFCIETMFVGYIHSNGLENICEIYGLSAKEVLTENLAEKYAGKRFHYSR